MTTTAIATETRNCLRCGRKLRSAEALARGYGRGCWSKVRQAEQGTDLAAWTASQAEDARQAIEDGAVVPSNREGVFHVVSTDGSEVHLVHPKACNCTNGLKTRPSRPCWHRCAVAIVLAAAAPATRPAGTSPRNIPALPAPDDDVWAALEAAGALDLVPAF
jgi:hypothetical protein